MEQSCIGEAILALENAYNDVEIEFKASFDDAAKIFTIGCFAKDSPEMQAFHKELFWEIPPYFPLSDDSIYCFSMTTYRDIGASLEKAVFTMVMETSLGLMPKRGNVTQEQWKEFIAQLKYTINGEDAVLDFPEN